MSGATTTEPGGAGVGAGGVASHHGVFVVVAAGAGSAAAVAREGEVAFQEVFFFISLHDVKKKKSVKAKQSANAMLQNNYFETKLMPVFDTHYYATQAFQQQH